MLQARCEINASPHMHCVVGLQNIFSAVIEFAVAEQEAEAAIGEVGLMIFTDCIADESDAGAVLFAVPPGSVGAESLGESLIDFCISEGFGLAVIPAEAGEGSEVGQEI